MTETNRDLVEELREMGTRRLVRWLTTPALSGFFLSPADMQRIGASLGVPVTPFGRANGLEQLLRGAAIDDRLGDALSALRQEMAAHLARYQALDLPALDSWIDRATATLGAWTAIEAAFAEEEGP
ncbi:MAG: hypothetical protein R3A46_08910 [Thermomicrobiales bacterium]